MTDTMIDAPDCPPPLLVIVEDDTAFARTLKRSFERRDYRVLTAASHDELAELLRTERPAYAVVDLKLGGASGLACVATLRADACSSVSS